MAMDDPFQKLLPVIKPVRIKRSLGGDRDPQDVAVHGDHDSEKLPVSPIKSSVANTFAIQVETEEDRPFELADLFTRRWIRRNSGFLVSLIVHLAIFLILSAVILHGTGKAMILLEAMTSTNDEIEHGTVLIEELEDDEGSQDDSIGLEDQGILESVAESDLVSSANGQSGDSGGNGDGADGTDDGKGNSAKFFGMRAVGKTFVYVLDQSGSMGTNNKSKTNDMITRYEVASAELLGSVNSLEPDQEFYVILFSTESRMMWNDVAVLPRPQKATPENKKRLEQWLKTTGPSGGTDPRRSIKLALDMNPDAIFMLSDGDFSEENRDNALPRTVEIVRQHSANNRNIAINSIAFEDESAQANMKELAAVSGGQYNFVELEQHAEAALFGNNPKRQVAALKFLVEQPTTTWDMKEKWAHEVAIPLLQNPSSEVRRDAEQYLEFITFGYFEKGGTAINGANDDLERSEISAVWSDRIKNLSSEIDQKNAESSFFAKLLGLSQEEAITLLEQEEMDSFSASQLLGIARYLLDYQERTGELGRTREVLLPVLKRLNQNFSPIDEMAFENANIRECRAEFERVLASRESTAKRLYREWDKEIRFEPGRSEKFIRMVIKKYPETSHAKMLRAELVEVVRLGQQAFHDELSSD